MLALCFMSFLLSCTSDNAVLPDPEFQIDSYVVTTTFDFSSRLYLVEEVFSSNYAGDIFESLQLNRKSCLQPLGVQNCQAFVTDRSFSFAYQNELLSGVEVFSDGSIKEPVELSFADGRLTTITTELLGESYQTNITYEGSRLSSIEYGREGIENLIYTFEFFYEGENLVSATYQNLGQGATSEFSFLYDDALNPFYKKTAWLVGLIISPTTIQVEGIPLFASRNVLLSSSVTRNGNEQAIAVRRFNTIYDVENRPIETSSKSNGVDIVATVSYR